MFNLFNEVVVEEDLKLKDKLKLNYTEYEVQLHIGVWWKMACNMRPSLLAFFRSMLVILQLAV